MKSTISSSTLAVLLYLACVIALTTKTLVATELERGWDNPPPSARLKAYWWWLNGNVTKEAVTRDLKEMKAQGFGGALIYDANGSNQRGNAAVPHGPDFFSPAWRELYRHALREADRLGMVIDLTIQSGWNLGGPMVKAEDAAQQLTWSEHRVSGLAKFDQRLPEPKHRDPYYRDMVVLAYPLPGTGASEGKKSASAARRPIENFGEKAMYKRMSASAPDTSHLLKDVPPEPGEEDLRRSDVRDLTALVDGDGVLHWEVPAGDWQILRFGHTVGDRAHVSTSSDGWKGYAIDVLNADAFRRYWETIAEPLIADAGPLAGRTLKHLQTDSWEIEPINWTPALFKEFRQRRGYDPLCFMPVLAGRIVDSRTASNRFLNDFRKTMGELAIDSYYKPFLEGARRHGLQTMPEAGGPHAVPIDAQRCLGWTDVPMGEFWAESWSHRVKDQDRLFIKQPASAAHTYGRRLVAAEGFTTIGPHWQETIWDNLKPSFDKALCEGLNLLVWSTVICSPQEAGLPGNEYFAGTHFNPNVTWWSKSGPFLAYINRCQWMLQQGQFVADACYYYGDHVPNFAQLKRSDPARVLPGYDYDVVTEEILLSRMTVSNGRLVLPDGMSYRMLVLPDRESISLPVLKKLKDFAEAGATILGPKPTATTTLSDYPACDAAIKEIAQAMWPESSAEGTRKVGQGRIIAKQTAREVLLADGIAPDFEYAGDDPKLALDYIHRRDAETEIYFVTNYSKHSGEVRCTFRVKDKTPELWNPVTGERRFATAYSQSETRTTVPLEFTPCGSWFVVFRKSASAQPSTGERNFPQFQTCHEFEGPWTVQFDPRWGGPKSVQFQRLENWIQRQEQGIKYYSGTAIYQKTFDLTVELQKENSRLFLDLGKVCELAEVRLNGKSLGILWSPPFRVEVTKDLKPTGNVLEIEVVNFWPNRIIGDQFLPEAERLTRTNIRKLDSKTKLMDSGLLGPVRLLKQQ